jgi:hypothetical protein
MEFSGKAFGLPAFMSRDIPLKCASWNQSARTPQSAHILTGVDEGFIKVRKRTSNN